MARVYLFGKLFLPSLSSEDRVQENPLSWKVLLEETFFLVDLVFILLLHFIFRSHHFNCDNHIEVSISRIRCDWFLRLVVDLGPLWIDLFLTYLNLVDMFITLQHSLYVYYLTLFYLLL